MFLANEGVGVLSFAGRTGGWSAYQGTLLNGAEGWEAGEALGIRSGMPDGMAILVELEEYSLGTMTLSLAAKRSSTGFTSLVVEVLQPAGWVELSSQGLGLTWSLIEVPVALDQFDFPVSMLRLSLDGATSSQGTARFDNLRIVGSVIPGAGGLWAFGPAATAIARRRRRPTPVF